MCVGLTVLARGVSVWQREALCLCFPVVALAPHVGERTLQVGDPLLCGLKLNRGDRIGVSALERGLSVHRKGASELRRVDEPRAIILPRARERAALDGAQDGRASHASHGGGLCKRDHSGGALRRVGCAWSMRAGWLAKA